MLHAVSSGDNIIGSFITTDLGEDAIVEISQGSAS